MSRVPCSRFARCRVSLVIEESLPSIEISSRPSTIGRQMQWLEKWCTTPDSVHMEMRVGDFSFVEPQASWLRFRYCRGVVFMTRWNAWAKALSDS